MLRRSEDTKMICLALLLFDIDDQLLLVVCALSFGLSFKLYDYMDITMQVTHEMDGFLHNTLLAGLSTSIMHMNTANKKILNK